MRIRATKQLKKLQLFIHNNYVEIRHWILVVLGVTLLVFSMVSVANSNSLIEQTKTLAEQNKALNERNQELTRQVKATGEDNQAVTKQNRDYIRCLGEIIAQYTHDFVPINIISFDQCVITTGGDKKNLPAKKAEKMNSSKSNPSGNQPKQSAPSNMSPPQDTPTQEPATPLLFPEGQGVVRDSVPLLGIL